MHPLEVYYLRQAGRGQYDTGICPSILLHLFFNADTDSEIFSAVYFVGINPSFGKEPRLSNEKSYVPKVKFFPILQKTDHPKLAPVI